MAELKTDYKDQLLDSSVNTKRVYNLVDADGNVVRENVSLEDVTVYSQDGDNFGAADINKTNEEVNQLNRNLTNINVYVGDDKKLHFVDKDGADSVLPFSSGIKGYGELSVRNYMVLDVTDFATLKITLVMPHTDDPGPYGICVYSNDTFDMEYVSGNDDNTYFYPGAGSFTLLGNPKTVDSTVEFDVSDISYIDIMPGHNSSKYNKFLYELS